MISTKGGSLTPVLSMGRRFQETMRETSRSYHERAQIFEGHWNSDDYWPVFSIIGGVLVGGLGAEFSILNVLTGVAVPALYIYGAVLNSKADDTQPTA